ncbi:pantoate--beta-alanine ligase [Egicoccus halophilus]|uniref:Pantothenate synthetase n=1 Tax=Egicoccus halophilus TaxID=1670830 RepID=A0A8J3A990_9ACTN|nr:pantoate--beta-alanine ligase [Egicoccus halophilus]GGI07768.1 pantothenate synthetase [Egicoccus halophilus]
MRRVTSIADLRTALAAERRAGRTVALAPTMGALHDGHLANVRRAAAEADVVVVSIFVNPTQFDRADDLAAYPRTLDADEAALRGLGGAAPAYVFAPFEREMYPTTPTTTVHVGGGITEVLEGASRPGHFDGVATVVTKLFHVVEPDVALFGRKDAQQNLVIRRFVTDLDVPVRLVFTPTVREADGLARSSRNQRLSAGARAAAVGLPRALRAGVLAARVDREADRAPDPGRVRHAALATLASVPDVAVDYLEVVDPDTLAPPDAARGEAAGVPAASSSAPGPSRRLLVATAAVVGGVRLIDNVEVGDVEDEDRLLAATD